MWYRYLNRTADELRMFRKANLKFNQDDYGMFKNKFLNSNKDLLFRLARSEGYLRGFSLLLIIGAGSALGYVKSTLYDPVYGAQKAAELKRKDEQADRKARELLYYNNLGAPTRPTRKMEDFMAFIGSNEAIAKNFEYLMYGLNLSADQMAGLDSYSSENDERMLELMAESKKRSGGH